MANIHLRTQIAAPPHTVFDLSRSIDIHTESMSKSAEKAIAGVTGGLIELGEEVTWEGRHFGIRFQMTSKIVQMSRPFQFVDEQVRGPFKTWSHLHIFESDGGENTSMLDQVDYVSPFGILGRIADRLFLSRYMTDLMVQRNEHIKNAAESA